jgi:hypothetical protein
MGLDRVRDGIGVELSERSCSLNNSNVITIANNPLNTDR